MKSPAFTFSSSEKSSTGTSMEDDQSENRDSCYYPGCLKDANCNCKICLASINATLDLMPMSIQKGSLTKLSASRPTNKRIPISFDPSIASTPRSSTCKNVPSPVLKSTARFNFPDQVRTEKPKNKDKNKKRNNKGEWGCWGKGKILSLILFLNLILAAEFGFSWLVSGVLNPVLSLEIVKSVGEKSWVVRDLNGRLRFLQRELEGFVPGKVSNCSYVDSKWKVNHDGSILNSRCILYKSTLEEVSIWGWPLQTAGLLTTGFSTRSFTILSGRVTEWHDGNIGYSIRKAKSSWVQRKWGDSVVQFDPNTWILEYQWSSVLVKQGLLKAAAEFLRYRMSVLEKSGFSFLQTHFSNDIIKVPT